MRLILWTGSIIIAGVAIGMTARHFLTAPASPDPTSMTIASGSPSPDASQERPASASTDYQVGEHIGGIPEAKQYVPSSQLHDGFREIAWEELMPANWDPMAPFKNLKIDDLDDADPRAVKALEEAKKIWDKAPVNPTINDTNIRIPGFVVSLDQENADIREFLLVPYFGACIHTPPPPANQIIHVRSSKPIKGVRTMDPVWIQGTLKVSPSETQMGSASYSMQSSKVELYEN